MRIPRGLTMLKWLFCFVTAVIVAFVAAFMGVLIALAFKSREVLVRVVRNAANDGIGGLALTFFGIYGVFNVGCAALGSATVLLGSGQASGSGIPELVAFLNGVDVPNFLTLKTFFMKVVGATLTVAASLPVGYQGVLLHIGAMIAYLLSRHLPHFELSTGPKRPVAPGVAFAHCMATVKSTPELGVYSNDAEVPVSNVTASYMEEDLEFCTGPTASLLPERPGGFDGSRVHPQDYGRGEQHQWHGPADRVTPGASTSAEVLANPQRVHFLSSTAVADLVACGAAAGVSAAFKAPVGGMLYLMELSTRWRLELTWRTFFSTSVTAVVLKLLLTGCEHSRFCGFIVPSGSNAYVFSTPYEQLPIIGVFSIIIGMLGAMFVSLNSKLVKLRKSWSHSKPMLFCEVLLLSMTTTGAYFMLTCLGRCKPCDEDAPSACFPGAAENALAHAFCGEGQYNDLATLVVSPTGDVIHTFWSMRYDDFATRSLALFIPVYFLLACWTSGVAIPSGSFNPTILLGSAIGRLFAHILQLLRIVREPDATLYSLLGAAGFFTGQTRMTVSLCVILLEMTECVSVLPFVMLVVIVAKGTADRMGDSTILRRIHLKNLPFLARLPHLSVRRYAVTADDVCLTREHPVLPKDADVEVVRQRLNDAPTQNVFVIVDSLGLGGFGGRSYAPSECATEPFDRLARPRSANGSRSCGLHPGSPRSMLSEFTNGSNLHSVLFLGVVSRSVLQSHLAKHEQEFLRILAQREVADASACDVDTTPDPEWPASIAGSAFTGYGSMNIHNLNTRQSGYVDSESSMLIHCPLPPPSDSFTGRGGGDGCRGYAAPPHEGPQASRPEALDLASKGDELGDERDGLLGSGGSTPTQPLWGGVGGLAPLPRMPPRGRKQVPAPPAATRMSVGFPEGEMIAQDLARPPSVASHGVDGETSARSAAARASAAAGARAFAVRGGATDEALDIMSPFSGTRLGGPAGSEYDRMPEADAVLLWQSKIDLTPIIQVPPLTIAPNMSLEAIFHLMNNMGLELLPVVAPGGIYHGLITRSSVIRYQRKLDQREEFHVLGARHLLRSRLNLKTMVRRN